MKNFLYLIMGLALFYHMLCGAFEMGYYLDENSLEGFIAIIKVFSFFIYCGLVLHAINKEKAQEN